MYWHALSIKAMFISLQECAWHALQLGKSHRRELEDVRCNKWPGCYPNAPKTLWENTHTLQKMSRILKNIFHEEELSSQFVGHDSQRVLLFTVDNILWLSPVLPAAPASSYCLQLKPLGLESNRVFSLTLGCFNITLTILFALKGPGSKWQSFQCYELLHFKLLQIALQNIWQCFKNKHTLLV